MGSSDLPHKGGHPNSQAPRKDGRSRKVQEKLDDALADSFPASDPVSIVTSHAEEDWVTREGSSDREAADREGKSGSQGQRPPGTPARSDAPPPGNTPAGGHSRPRAAEPRVGAATGDRLPSTVQKKTAARERGTTGKRRAPRGVFLPDSPTSHDPHRERERRECGRPRPSERGTSS